MKEIIKFLDTVTMLKHLIYASGYCRVVEEERKQNSSFIPFKNLKIFWNCKKKINSGTKKKKKKGGVEEETLEFSKDQLPPHSSWPVNDIQRYKTITIILWWAFFFFFSV